MWAGRAVIRSNDLGLAALGFLELEPPALIDVAARAGFSMVSVRTRAAVPGGPEFPLTAGSRRSRETLARIRDTGVGILQVELLQLGRDTDVASTRAMLEGAAALGASRVVATGDDPDDHVLADRLARLCDLAAEYRMIVDLEFMPFRHLATLPQALRVVALAARDNACVMIDALHLFRSGGTVADVAAAAESRLGVCQLCDAPLAAPPRDQLAVEAREQRLLPGGGELPLRSLLEALPGALLVAEVPMGAQSPALSPAERARLVHRSTSALLTGTAPNGDGPPGGPLPAA
jgi:sugar phosphate isomerase/epimerase